MKLIGFVIILIVANILSGCSKELKSDSILFTLDDYSLYPKVVEQILPKYTTGLSDNNAYYILDNGAVAEAFDTQAAGAIGTGIANHWYPQYLATVVIAVDRNQTDADVTSWNDLLATQQEVGFSDTPGNVQMLLAAMAYGLEGGHYTLTKPINLLTSLQERHLLKINSFEAPIIICYDYQAVNLMEKGRNLQIIVPEEGTLTYEKGLLSNEDLNFSGDVNQVLLAANLRLLDGESNLTIYPDERAYRPAIRVDDYNYFSKATQNASCLMERNVLKARIYMSIDQREHLFFALIYIIIVTIWVVAIMIRSMQKGITYAALFTGIILNGWILVRLIKYQVLAVPILSRYLWYSYYIFQLSLPLVLLWMAWSIDKPKNETCPPKWWRVMAICIGFLLVLVFTNDLHGLVFHLELNRPDWDINYGYGIGYYTVLFVCMANLVAVFVILVQKSLRNPRKKRFLFPLTILLTFGVYNYLYITRFPFVYATDLTIVTGIFAMLLFETCIRSGLIPVNTKYIDIFTRSPLKLQIINQDKDVILMSASAVSINMDDLDKVLASTPAPILQKDDSLLFANPIPGGYALWQEDIRKLRQLQKEIQKSTQMLKDANVMLAEEEKLKRMTNEKNAKKDLMEQLGGEIDEHIIQLSTMIEKLAFAENPSQEITRIALLLCYIKRRCNLFFKEKANATTDSGELIIHIKELSEITYYSNVQIAISNEIKESIAIRHATLLYDFFYWVVDLAVQKGCPYIIAHLRIDEGFLTMGLLPSEDIGFINPESKLIVAITAEKGEIVTKDVDDTIGISISFPKGGVAYD
ncbi:ABC transporter substrate-binding protein [Clostridia bacterium]|nr:ABC transporter substrate-binding protein [Clostridia bacterium]